MPDTLRKQTGNNQDKNRGEVGSNTGSVSERTPSSPAQPRSAARKKHRAPPASSADRASRREQEIPATSPKVSYIRSPGRSTGNRVSQQPSTTQDYEEHLTATSERDSGPATTYRSRSSSSSASSDYDGIRQSATNSTRSPLRSRPSTALTHHRGQSYATPDSHPRAAAVHQLPGSSIIGHFVPSTRPGALISGEARPPPPTQRPTADRRGYETPDSDDEPEEVDKAISKLVDFLFQKEPDFTQFYMWHAKPTADNMVKVYRLIRKLADKYVNIVAPFRSKKNLIIEEVRVPPSLTTS